MFKSEKGCVSGGILSGSSQFWKKPPIWCYPTPQSHYETLSKVCVDKLDWSWTIRMRFIIKVWPTQATGPTCKPLTVCTNKAGVIRLIRSSPAGFLTWPLKLPLPTPDYHFRRNMFWSVSCNHFSQYYVAQKGLSPSML